jgi:hypothetical protein
MHAYASDDPVFLAMNQRGQRETGGALGSFCVNCHAPMAVHEGATTDGTNLASVPQKLKGVTCFFCHTVDAVAGAHDNPLHLASDIVMRGEYGNTVATVHPSAYSTLHDRNLADSAGLCGSCHDIVNGHGAAIERTYAEWQQSVFSHAGGATCGQCHMDESTMPEPISSQGTPPRSLHDHGFPGVDLTLTAGFPQAAAQQVAVQALQDSTLQSALCVEQAGTTAAIRVVLENVAAGHGVPSGASQDRRLWTEVVAYKAGQVIYQSGVVPDGTPVTSLTDPDLWLLRDCMVDASQKPVDMFWQAFGFESNALPAQATFDMTDPRYYQTHVVQYFPRNPMALLSTMPDMVTLRVRLQPVGLDVLSDLVASGDLDASVPPKVQTMDLDLGGGSTLVWTPATATATYPEGAFTDACVTHTNLNVAADKVPAVNHTLCKP